MLTELGFFNTVATEEEVALQNYAKVILAHLGVLSPSNVPQMVEALLKMPSKGTTHTEGDK